MKKLKILFTLIIPAIGFVGCQKSEMKPACQVETTKSISNSNEEVSDKAKEIPTSTSDVPVADMKDEPNDDSLNSVPLGRSGSGVEEDEEEFVNVVGSGDDDRDGGGKRHKK